MKKKYYVQYETKVTMTAIVYAESKEEAINLAEDGDYEDTYEDDSDGFHVVDVRSEEISK